MSNEWIYTKDRLPERSMKYVLVTLSWPDGVRVLGCTTYSAKYKKFNATDLCGDAYALDNVMAWMPAPEMAEVRS